MKCCSKQCAVSQLREKITVIVAKIVQKTTDVVIYLDYEETKSQKVPFSSQKNNQARFEMAAACQHENKKSKENIKSDYFLLESIAVLMNETTNQFRDKLVCDGAVLQQICLR